MENIENIYTEITGVNLQEQKQVWNERGKGYYGEFLVFSKLFREVATPVKFLMNLQIPTYNNKSTEIDLIMLHETGIYVFEIKHYKGTIYGKTKDEHWTQFFKTAQNQVFKNPVLQNNYHIRALESLVQNVPIYSVIVFSNDECDIRVSSITDDLIICNLCDLCSSLKSHMQRRNVICDIEKLNSLFNTLLPYSHLNNKTVTNHVGEVVPFYDYFDSLKEKIEIETKTEKTDLVDATHKLNIEKRTYKFKLYSWAFVVAIIASIVSYLFCQSYQLIYDKKSQVMT